MVKYRLSLKVLISGIMVIMFGCSNSDGSNPNNNSNQSGFVNEVDITIQGSERVITSNGIPEHDVGDFPNANNPNSISEQNYEFRMPVNPQAGASVTSIYGENRPGGSVGYKVGVAINGVPFDPAAAEFWNNDFDWRYEPIDGAINLGTDASNAHVQPNGAYHYHGIPTGLIDGISSSEHSTLYGYAADGFPIYVLYGYQDAGDKTSGIVELKSSYRLKTGTRPSGSNGPGGSYDGTYVQDFEYVSGTGDLDECNGRFGITPEYPNGTYYYVITNDFPFIPRCFYGAPDQSFAIGPPN